MDVQAQALLNAGRMADLSRIPIWSGGKEVFTAEQWIDRINRSKTAGNWNDALTMSYVFNAMRGPALRWFDALPRLGCNREVWNDFRKAFINTYGSTRTARTAALTLSDIKQGASEQATDYISRVIQIIDDVELLEPEVLPQPAAPWSDAFRAMAGFAASTQPDRDFQANLLMRHGAKGAFDRLGRHLFIAGLKPALRTELMKANPQSLQAALEAALDAEKILLEPKRQGQRAVLANIDNDDEEEKDEEEDEDAADDEEDAAIAAVTAKLKHLKKKATQRKKRQGGASKPPKKKPDGSANKQQAGKGTLNNGGNNDGCRYCHAKGHFQASCLKRKAAGAPMIDQFGNPYQTRAPVNNLQQRQMPQDATQWTPQMQMLMQGTAFNPFSHMTQPEQSGGGGVGALWNKNPWERVNEGNQLQYPPPSQFLNY
jgi:hypothetical protein